MQKGKFNVLTDLQWGSVGKGLFSGYFAWRHRPEHISTTSMANAGHTVVYGDDIFIAKALPASAFLNAVDKTYNPTVWIGPTAAFHADRMLEEIDVCKLRPEQVKIHPRAGVITPQHRETENDLKVGTKHLASTMQGCGAFLSDKVMRRKELRLARDYPELAPFTVDEGGYYSEMLASYIMSGETCYHEGAQGFSLDVHHGSHYPQCTSRQTTAVQNLADMGLPTRLMGDVFGAIRPYPIRVGNVQEGGQTVGHSGGAYPGQAEISWDEVAKRSGADSNSLLVTELTTVTKRLRRVFEFSMDQVRYACLVNGVNKICLNFANYLDWDCYGTGGEIEIYNDLPDRVKNFVVKLETGLNIPVALIGTGPDNAHIVNRLRGEAVLAQ